MVYILGIQTPSIFTDHDILFQMNKNHISSNSIQLFVFMCCLRGLGVSYDCPSLCLTPPRNDRRVRKKEEREL